ncbi:hypothetical protein SDC9_124714 [bioreactor metagenome]|uniref:Uncharacterized protein n=1 Tax=bioreactor metagenome TaxID=1076179 RepID=A0A645CL65_9ZZZZ
MTAFNGEREAQITLITEQRFIEIDDHGNQGHDDNAYCQKD